MHFLQYILFLLIVVQGWPFLHSDVTSFPKNKPICTRPFSNSPTTYTFSSTHADVAVWDSGGPGKPVVFVHGNSLCKEVFMQQFNSELTQKYRFIAFDLPGHGQSSKASDPEKIYCLDGYAQVLIELMGELHLENPFLVGWSLGGHIVLEALAKGQKCAGVLMTGTPPIEVSYKGFQKGFRSTPEMMHLWSKKEFTKDEALLFLHAGKCRIDPKHHPFVLEAVLKTDGRCRDLLTKTIGTTPCANHKILVETNDTPLCMVLGTEDNLNLDYVTTEVKYLNLFTGKVHLIEGAGHTVFWEQPQLFNAILANFLDAKETP